MWPAGSALEPARDRHTLIMVAHPQCTCSRASIAELARLTSRLRERVATYVLFLKPVGTDSDWTRSGLWKDAAALAGVTVIADEGGRKADRFGALTSGQTYLFDRNRRLLFRGGITPGRAHEGDNVGRDRIAALVEGHGASRSWSEVYGCALREATNTDPWFSWMRQRAIALNP